MIGIRTGLSYDLCSSRTSRRHPGSWKTWGFSPWILMIYGFFKWHNYGKILWFMMIYGLFNGQSKDNSMVISYVKVISLCHRINPTHGSSHLVLERKTNALPVSQTDRLISYGQVDLHGFVGLPWYLDWLNGKIPMVPGSDFPRKTNPLRYTMKKHEKTSPCEISLFCMVIVENFVGYITKKKFLTHIKYIKYSYWKWPGIIIDLPIKTLWIFPIKYHDE